MTERFVQFDSKAAATKYYMETITGRAIVTTENEHEVRFNLWNRYEVNYNDVMSHVSYYLSCWIWLEALFNVILGQASSH